MERSLPRPCGEPGLRREEESVAQFVRRKFGHEILEYLVSPFVSGVYAGRSRKAEPARGVSHARRMGAGIRQRPARRDEIAAGEGSGQRTAAAVFVSITAWPC